MTAPEPSGTATLNESRRDQRLRIWRAMTPEQRDYDRFVGKIPAGATWACETAAGALAMEERRKSRGYSVYETGCSCHIAPPCSFCVRATAEETDE